MEPISPNPSSPKSVEPPIQAGEPSLTPTSPQTGQPLTLLAASSGRYRNLVDALALLAVDEGTNPALRLEPGLQALNRLRLDWIGWLSPKSAASEPSPEALQEPLGDVLLRVLAQPQGDGRLLQAFRDLPHPAVMTLLHAGLNAAQPPMDGSAQPNLGRAAKTENPAAPFLRALLRAVESDSAALPGLSLPTSPPAARAPSGWARVLEATASGDLHVGDAGRVATGGGSTLPGTPLLRLQLWDGEKSFSLLAPESPPLGMPVRYAFSDVTSLRGTVLAEAQKAAAPQELLADYAQTSPEGRRALAAAESALSACQAKPWYAQAVRDFAPVLQATGWFSEATPSQPVPASDAEALLGLWLRFPPEVKDVALTLPHWTQGLSNPTALLKALNLFSPLPNPENNALSPAPDWQTRLVGRQNATVLTPETLLLPTDARARTALATALDFSALDHADGSMPGITENHGEHAAIAANGAKTLEQWLALGSNAPTSASSDPASHALRSLLQVLSEASHDVSPSQVNPSPSDAPITVFMYQASQWHALRLQPEGSIREEASQKRTGKGREGGRGWQAQVDWTGDSLGETEACLKLAGDAIDLEVGNRGAFAQAQLAAEIPRLEAALGLQGLTLKAWHYQQLPESNSPPPVEDTPELRVPRPPQTLDLRF